MRTSQASCYHLPTPTQLLTAVTPVLNPNNTFPPEFASYFRRFFLAEDDSSNKTALKYVTVAGKDSDNYTLDFSMWNVLGISGPAGTSILIHHGGVRLSTAKCELTVDFEIANFTDQLRRAALVHKTSSRSHTFSRRHIQKEFLVQLRFQTQCGGTPNINLNPWVNLGPSSCLALDQDHTYGYYRWDCQFPGKDSEEMKCEAAVTNFLDLVAGGLMGSTTNWATVGDLVLRGLAKLVNRNVLLALALSAGLTFTSPATLAILAAVETTFVVGTQSLAVIETALAVYNHYSDHGIAEDICMILHKNEFPVPLIVNAGSTVKTLAQLSAPPADISQSIKIVDPNEKTCHVCHNSAVNCTSAAGCLGLETACGEGCHCIRSMEGVQFCAWMFYPPYRTNWQTCYSSDQCAINNLCWATAFGNNPGQVGPTAPTCMFSAPHTCGFPDIAA